MILDFTAENVARVVALLRAGGVVAVPTDTVYGLMADAGNAAAVAKVFAAKGRDDGKKLLVNVGDLAEAENIAVMDGVARELAGKHWPGKVSLVVPARPDVGLCAAVVEADGTVGVRVPDHAVALAVLRAFGGPLTSTSANLSGAPTPPDAAGVWDALGDGIDAVLDGGICDGLPSTVVRCFGSRYEICRMGAVEIDMRD